MPLFIRSSRELGGLLSGCVSTASPHPPRRRRVRPLPVPDPLEAVLQTSVLHLATLLGWSWWHDEDSRRNRPGFVDALLWRPPRLIAAEFKRGRRRTTAEQRKHLAFWRAVGAEAIVWRPKPYPREQWPLVETNEPCDLAPLGGGPLRSFGAGAIERRLWAPARHVADYDARVAAASLPEAVVEALVRFRRCA